MKLKSLRIRNYRGYRDSGEIDFANFNCIVGPNDSGKTTILKAIEVLTKVVNVTDEDYHGKPNSNKDSRIAIIATYTVDSDLPEVYNHISNNNTFRYGKFFIRKKDKYEWNCCIGFPKDMFPCCPEDGKLQEEIQLINSSVKILKTYGSKEIECVGDYCYVPLELIKGIGIKETDIKFRVPKVKFLQTEVSISDLQELYIQKKLHKQIADLKEDINKIEFGKYKFDLSGINFTMGVKTSVELDKGNKYIPLCNKGEGSQLEAKIEMFKKLIELDEAPNIILILEEPETHLHPSAQRNLCKTIKDLANSHYQVMITTHSPFLVKSLGVESMITISKDKTESHANKFDPSRMCLPYGSLNEVNYLAFDEASVEYHIELFGYLQFKLGEKYDNDNDFEETWNRVMGGCDIKSVTSIDKWLEFHGVDNSNPFKHTTKGTDETHTLPHCVRNHIDHPTPANSRYDDMQLRKASIEIMQNAIKQNWDNVF